MFNTNRDNAVIIKLCTRVQILYEKNNVKYVINIFILPITWVNYNILDILGQTKYSNTDFTCSFLHFLHV